MTTAIKSVISPFAQPKANATLFLDEHLASSPASGIPEDFRKLSYFFSVIVLVPQSAVEDEATRKSWPRINPSLAPTTRECLLTAGGTERRAEF